ncbi:MAG: LamG-like jellyroll fold domain-containing protein [Cyanobacteria bacterium J06633_8]
MSFWEVQCKSSNSLYNCALYEFKQAHYTSTAYNDGEWHHLAVVKNTSGLTFYVDGIPVETAINSSSINDDVNLTIGQLTNDILTGLLKVTLISYTVFPKESHPYYLCKGKSVILEITKSASERNRLSTHSNS